MNNKEIEKIIISKEDLDYLNELLNKAEEYINLIGKIEIEKTYLIKQYENLSSKINEYNTQLFSKYKLDSNYKYEIDSINGEIIRKN